MRREEDGSTTPHHPRRPESDPPPSGAASRLAGLFLLFYPPAFRRDVGAALVGDVARRAAEHAASGTRMRYALWLLRLSASLLGNAPAAWLDELIPRRRRTPFRRERRGRIAGGGRWTEDRERRSSSFSWLDVKLGVRMLLKYPGLTLAGGLGIAVAIGCSVGFFAFAYTFFYPTLPIYEGERLVGLENWDLERNNEERRSLHDFVLWREEMRSVEDMSAFRTVSRNIGTGDGPVELVRLADMTPSGFELARVPPLMGRTLVAADAEPGAPDVLVIGYDVWRTKFAADPDVIGRDVRIGRVVHTIVGVMPDGFAFPMNHHYWIPFRERPADYPMGEGPGVFISGRLAPGYTLEDAQAELTVIGARMATEFPATHARFRAQVMPYIYPLVDVNQKGGEGFFWEFTAMNGLIGLLLVLVGLNVAVLVYARTATRRGEIAVRTALGASRGRVVGQLFVESLVLAVLSAAIGLGLAKVGMSLGNAIMATEVAEQPFWMELGIPAPALLYTVLLTALAATITGILPGLQATGKRVHENLRQYHSGTGLRLGRTWTTLVVVQVAVTAAGIPWGLAEGADEVLARATMPTYPMDRILSVRIFSDEEGLTREEVEEYRASQGAYLAGVRDELIRRMRSEPGVVAYAPLLDLPIGSGSRVVAEDVDGGAGTAEGEPARGVQVHPEFFPVFEATVLAGRPILRGDLDEEAADVAVVDRTFVGEVLGGGEALGRRIRFVTPNARGREAEGEERWFEIVGVVENQDANLLDEALLDPHVYVPPLGPFPGGEGVLFKVAGVDPADLTGPVREILSELDPTLRLSMYPVSRLYEQERLAVMLVSLVLVLVIGAVLLLSAAGIYALMSFTVSQRRREIGIRTALGAQRGRLLGGIFSRAAGQLGAGVTIGVVVTLLLDWRFEGDWLHGYGGVLIPVAIAVTLLVGLLAAVGPARRGLAVAPAEALQSE